MINREIEHYKKSISNLGKTFFFLIIVWTLIIISFTSVYLYLHYQSEFTNAKNVAKGHLVKDYLYRRWVSKQGGIYLPVTDEIIPNPYLTGVTEKNFKAPSGRDLTLVNPAYMTRLVHQFAADEYDIKGHITSLKPIRPQNLPDDWERSVLNEFIATEGGESVAISEINGVRYLRYMQAMKTEVSCLKCHGAQGYKVNEIRGGISVSIPWGEYQARIAGNSITAVSLHVIIWLLGLSGLVISFRRSRDNINKMKLYSDGIREREQQFTLVFENSSEAIIWANEAGEILNCNRAAENLLQKEKSEIAGSVIVDILQLKSAVEADRDKSCVAAAEYELEFIKKTGELRNLEVTETAVIITGTTIKQYMIRDITLRKKAEAEIENKNAELAAQNEEYEALNEELISTNNELTESKIVLQKSLKEKETLVRELYHRTKNTMQVIRGMLVIQADRLKEDDDINKLVEITDRRIQAISLVHQMLYSTSNLSKISIKNYITELTGLILQSFGAEEGMDLDVKMEIEDIHLLLDTAIPFGLIYNELLTNTLKYAFPEKDNGEVLISLRGENNGEIIFQYRDFGTGVPEDFDFRKQNSLGMELIFSIGEQQMMGEISFKSDNGLVFNFTFPAKLYEERV